MKILIGLIVALVLLTISIYLGTTVDVVSFSKFNELLLIVIIALLLIAVGAFIVLFLSQKKDKKIEWLSNRLEQWTNLSVHVNKAGDEVFSELPIGIIIYDENEEIKWVNRFTKLIFNDEVLEQKLLNVNEELRNFVGDNEESFIINVGEKSYDVIHKKDNRLLYLFDVSKREEITKLYDERMPAIGIINLDNLDNETKSFDMTEKINIRAQYLGEISDWASKYNGYLKSYDDGSLIIVCSHDAIKKMIENKFSLLTRIRDISQTNSIRVTASIGFACHDTNYEELGTLAQTAFDLAEKRGGDQVVVNIQNQKPQYFGASLNAVEKNNLLHARAKTLELKEIIEKSRNVYIMGHINTDADSFGACIGMLKMCLTSSKKASIVLDVDKIDNTTTKIYNELIISEDSCKDYIINFDQADVDENSLLIIVDTQTPRIVMDQSFLEKFEKIAVIDHHRAGEDSFKNILFSYVEPYASSTVELISEMLMFYNAKEAVELTSMEATALLTGIVVDTNNFTFRCGARAFEAASRLREKGADMILVRKFLRNDFDVQMQLNRYVTTAEIVLEQFAIVSLGDEVIKDRTLLAQISESLLNIDGVDASFTIARASDIAGEQSIAISARSYQNVNVQVIMEELGGGGHLNSAATLIKDKTIEEVKEMLSVILKRDYEIGENKMKVILLQDVKGRGNKNDIIDVATGFGNYLLVNKQAVLATDEALIALQASLEYEKNRVEDELKMIAKIKSEIEAKVINVYIKLGSDGRAFGTVTNKQISDELEAQYGIQVDKRKIVLPTEINTIGVFAVTINLHKDVSAQLEVNVLEK